MSVTIIGGNASRAWIVSDPPLEAEAGSPMTYDIVLDTRDLTSTPTQAAITYSLIGTLPAGVTLNGFTPNGVNATLSLNVGTAVTGYIDVGIVVTDSLNTSTAFQQITVLVVPAGTGGG